MYRSKLDAAAKSYALDNLGESEEASRDSVLKIKQFIGENPDINARSDDRTILCFLRSCKFNVEQTEKKIKK